MGKRNHTRSREVWSSRRRHKNKQEIKAILQLCSFDVDLVDQEPTSYEEAAQKKEWVEAMTEDYQSIMKSDVWDIVPKP